MDFYCSGYIVPSPSFPLPPIPEGWQHWLKRQTLANATTEYPDALCLLTHQLPEFAPSHLPDSLLETMAWALLSRPGCRAVVAPLYVSIAPTRPTTLLGCGPGRLNQIIASGYLALIRTADFYAMSFEPSFDAPIKKLFRKRKATAFRSRALISETVSRRGIFQDLPFRLSSQLKNRLKSKLTVNQKTHLKRLWFFCGRGVKSLRPSSSPLHVPLATMTRWSPVINRAGVAIQAGSDNRVPVLIAMHWLELGGAEKFAVQLIQSLSGKNYALYVVTDVPSENPWAGEIAPHAAAVFHLPEFLPDPYAELFYDHLIRSRNIHMMHIHHAPKAYAALFYLRRFHPGLRVVDTLHILEMPPNSGGYPESSCGQYEPFIDMHHVVSRHLGNFMTQRWRVPERKILVSYLNVDTDYFDPDQVLAGQLRNLHGISPNACLIGFIGRMVRQKQPLAFVEMAAILHQRWRDRGNSEDLGFVMIGSGPLMPDVRAAVEKAGLMDALWLYGETDEVRPLYKDLDLLVMPSENEGLALVTYEAMAMGLPVVFTDVGAQSELLPPELLVPNKAPVAERLADAAWPFIIDPMKRTATGETLRNHILAHHRSDHSFEEMAALYNQLLTTCNDSESP
ncbi:MAG: glycosyltransferase [Pseudomonadota bacterium]